MEEMVNINAPSVMPANSEIRAAAKASLTGRWTNAVLCTLVYIIIAGVCGSFSGLDNVSYALVTFGYALTLLIATPLGFGYYVAFLRHLRGEDDEELVTRPFDAFKNYGRYLGTSLLMTVFIILWALLLIVPGIIKSYSYAMTPYIMHDHPELGANECIDKSKEMMYGHKWKLFCLDLGFIGWILLCILTLGILTLWVCPWMSCARAKFYEELKARS